MEQPDVKFRYFGFKCLVAALDFRRIVVRLLGDSYMMPVPMHLTECVVPGSAKIDEPALKAKVQCSCRGKVFELLYPGQTHEYDGKTIPCVAEIEKKFYFLIRAKCVTCAKQHLPFDKDFHGWNGFVRHDPKQAKLPRPALVPWKCLECSNLEHKAAIVILTEGKEDFISETDGEIDEDR